MRLSRHAVAIGVLLAASGQAVAAEHAVTMAGGQYAPQKLTVAPGDTVRFVNDDTADHNVFAPTGGLAFDLGKLEPGQEATYAFVKAGTYDVECVFHPHMLTVVEVR
ncbi:MAG: cupredoxin domain-containing protein [Propylenella sp.]